MKGNTVRFQKTRNDIIKNLSLKLFKIMNQWARMLHFQSSEPITDIYLNSILESSLNNIYWINKKGTIIGCNDQQAKYMGLNNRMDLIGKNVLDIGCRNNDLHVMKNGKTHSIEENCLIDGEVHHFISSKSPMLDRQGNIIGLLGISTDITEQKKINRELEQEKIKAETANRFKDEFIANISHDIRTPLAGIYGIADLLKEKVPEEFQGEINAIAHASHELLNLLNGVIHISNLESGNSQDQSSKEFNLRDTVFSLMHLLTPLAQQKNLSMSVSYPDDIPQDFIGMPFFIQRVLLNIISNAIKFTSCGYVKIQVSQYPNKLFNQEVFPLLLTVEDTGMGMSQLDCEKIFEFFFRVNPSFQGQFPGCGLGLSIAKKFIEKMQGRIWVNSELGKGSQFFILLPLKIAQEVPSASTVIENEIVEHIQFLQMKPPPLPAPEPSHHSDRRILLVEDNILIQKAVANLLTKLNNNIDIAANGKKALLLVREVFYDLIFMDIGLPDIDGFTVSKQIREFNSEIPIIALTAHLDKGYRHICREAGINDIITKPLTLELAYGCLQQYTCKPVTC